MLLPSLRHGSSTALRAAAGPVRVRFLSSQPQGVAGSTVGILQQVAGWVRQNPTVIAVILTMTVVMYGFYRGSVRLMKFFFNVSDKQIFTLGFVGGVLVMLACGGAVWFASRRLTFHADDIYHAALNELRKHDLVTEKLGGAWRPGGFRGYSIESLQDAVGGSDRRARSTFFEAPARRVQMIFMVRGMDRDALVSLEAYKRSGKFIFDMLSLDFKPKPSTGHLKSEHLFLMGTSDHTLFHELNEFMDAARESGKPEKTMDEAMGE